MHLGTRPHWPYISCLQLYVVLTVDAFQLSKLEIQEEVLVCYVAVVCYKLRYNVIGNSCDIFLCKYGSGRVFECPAVGAVM